MKKLIETPEKPILKVDDLSKFNNDSFRIATCNFDFRGSDYNITGTKNTSGLISKIENNKKYEALVPKVRNNPEYRKLISDNDFVHPSEFYNIILMMMKEIKTENHTAAKELAKISASEQPYGISVELLRVVSSLASGMESIPHVNRMMNNSFVMQFAGTKKRYSKERDMKVMTTEFLHQYAKNQRRLLSVLSEPWAEGIWENAATLMRVKGAEKSRCFMPYTWFNVDDLARHYKNDKFEFKEGSVYVNGKELFRKGLIFLTEKRKFSNDFFAGLPILAPKPHDTVDESINLTEKEKEIFFENTTGKKINLRRFFSPSVTDISKIKESDIDDLNKLIKKGEACAVHYAIKDWEDGYGRRVKEKDIYGAPFTYTILQNPNEGVFQYLKRLRGFFHHSKQLFEGYRDGLVLAQKRVYEINQEREKAEKEKQKAASQLEKFLLVLGSAIESKDPTTGGHVERVAKYSRDIAEAMEFPKEKVREIYLGSIVHDVGKIGVKDEILNKPGRLDPEEWLHMKNHTTIGRDLLSRIEEIPFARNIAHYHQEKWDGSGYPEGLKGKDIPIEARIVAVADVWDALTKDRPYKKAFSVDKALGIMNKGRGMHFDPKIFDAFMDEKYKIYQRYLFD